jgi:hypothetical protein
MYWFWMNVPLAAAFFAIWTGVPLWLVLKHPDIGSGPCVPDTPARSRFLSPQRPRPATSALPACEQQPGVRGRTPG